MNRIDGQYIMGFLDDDGQFYDYYVADSLREPSTWNAVDFKFSLPSSKYLLIWRLDGKKLTKEESDYLTKYVRDDMKDFMDEPISSSSSSKRGVRGSQTTIRKKLSPHKKCLILAYDIMELPLWADDWEELGDEIKPHILKKMEEPKFSNLEDLALQDHLSGRIPTNPYLESYRFRNVEYQHFELPPDSTLREVYHKIKDGDFSAAANYLSGVYQISPPSIDLKNIPLGETFAFYDNLDSKIFLSLDKIPEFWQQLPAFFLVFFKHLSQSKNWKFSNNYHSALLLEKTEAGKFSQTMINRLLELRLDPR